MYNYIFFNSGEGCNSYHFILNKEQKRWVCPLRIEGIQEQGFCYSFWEEIFKCSFNRKADIHFLYGIHKKYLINQAKGTLRDDQTYWYCIPDLGVCTYSAVEMVSYKHLSKQERINFKIAQTIVTKQKQARVTKERFKRLKKNFYFSSIRLYHNFKSHVRHFKQSQRLLVLCQSYLQHSLFNSP